MTEQTAQKRRRSLVLAALVAITAGATLACGATYFEIPIETPIRAKLDVSAFQRVLIAGFVAGGTDDGRSRRSQKCDCKQPRHGLTLGVPLGALMAGALAPPRPEGG